MVMIFMYNKILSVYIYNADAIKFFFLYMYVFEHCCARRRVDEFIPNTPLLLYMPEISLINQNWNKCFICCTTSSVLLRKSTFD